VLYLLTSETEPERRQQVLREAMRALAPGS
jgi:hypothetical protein